MPLITLPSLGREVGLTFNRHIGLFAIASLALLISWRGTVQHMADIVWSVDVFSHGLLVPFVSAALIWARRGILQTIVPRFSYLGAAIVLAASALWLSGELIDVALFRHLGLVTAINGLVITFFGLQFYRAVLFAMLFLFLAIPFGYELVGPLQTMTANLVIGTLELVGATYKADGVLIELSSGMYEVAEACAGVKFFFTSLVTGVLLAHLVFESWGRRLFILIVSAMLPIAANALRVLGILAIAEMTDQSFAKDVDHIVYGWVFLSIVLFTLIAFAYRISDREASKAPTLAENQFTEGANQNVFGVIAVAMIPTLVTFVLPQTNSLAYREGGVQIEPLLKQAPAGYRVLPQAASISPPNFLNADVMRSTILRRNDHVFLASYARVASLHAGSRLFQPGNTLVGNKWSEMRGLVTRSYEFCDIAFTERIFRRGDRRIVTWSVYSINGEIVTSGLTEKMVTAAVRIMRKPSSGEILTLSGLVDSDANDIREVFSDFLSTFPPDRLLLALGGGELGDSIKCAG